METKLIIDSYKYESKNQIEILIKLIVKKINIFMLKI